MAERISPREFHESDGVEDWRVVAGAARAHFRTRSFKRGVELVEVIGRIADAANHHPDVDLRYGGLTVTLSTHDVGGLSELDVALARQVSAAARALDIPADPAGVRELGLTIEAVATAEVLPFWRALLDYRDAREPVVADPQGRGPDIRFQRVDQPRAGRNRIRVDVFAPRDHAEVRVAAALAAGGRLVSDAQAPQRWTLADPEGNEADVVTWMGAAPGGLLPPDARAG